METNEKLQIITCDGEAGMIILEALDIEPYCFFCGEKITVKNFGGVFPKPTGVCCDNICCLIKALPQD